MPTAHDVRDRLDQPGSCSPSCRLQQPNSARANRVIPVGTIGEATSLRDSNLQAQACNVVKQIETPRLPDPIMRRPGADPAAPLGGTFLRRAQAR
jgi:hypothetical protein